MTLPIDSFAQGIPIERRLPWGPQGYSGRAAIDTPRTVQAPVAASVPAGFAEVSRRYIGWLVVLDALIGVAGFTFTQLVGRAGADLLAIPLHGLPGLVWPLLIAACGGYRRSGIGVGTGEMMSVLRAGLWLTALGAYPAAFSRHDGWLLFIVMSAPPVLLLTLLVRKLARRRLHQLQSAGIGLRRTLAIGPEDSIVQLEEHLSREPHCGMLVQGVCLPGGRPSSTLSLPVLGDVHDVRRIVDLGGFEAVTVTGGEFMRESYLRRLSWSLEGSDAELLIWPGLTEIVQTRLHIRPLVGMPLLQVQAPRFAGWQRLVKRTMDVVLTAGGLLAISPLLAVTALAIKLEDGGPVLFRQTRIGRGEQPFEMLKFRSMVVDAEARKAALMSLNEGHGGLFKLKKDPRVTRVGAFIRRWSIDELPQLFNVLAGSMSLVGPRPHLAKELALMPAEASRRALVTPGLTGLWQISGRSDLPGSEGLRLDLRYVENWSVSLDLHIIWRTFWAVVKHTGAS